MTRISSSLGDFFLDLSSLKPGLVQTKIGVLPVSDKLASFFKLSSHYSSYH